MTAVLSEIHTNALCGPSYLAVEVLPITGHEGPRGEVEVQLYSFFNIGGRWGWVLIDTPRPL
jgi:hypothetical protein